MEPPDHIFPVKRRGHPSLLTPTREAWLRRLVAERPQATPKELAQAMGNIVIWQTVQSWCKKLGLPYSRELGRRTKMTPEAQRRLRSVVAQLPSASLDEIAQAMGNIVSSDTIRHWCIRMGLAYRRGKRRRSKMTPRIEARLRALMEKQSSPYFREITQAIGGHFNRRTVKKWCEGLGLAYKPPHGPRSDLTPAIETRLRALMAQNPTTSYKELAKSFGVHLQTVYSWVEHLGLPHQRSLTKFTPGMQERLRALVAERPSASYEELADVLQVHRLTVLRWVKLLGLPHRVYHKKLSPEAEERLRSLLMENPRAGYDELARALQVPIPTVRGCVKRLGIPHEGRPPRMSPDMETRLRSLMAEKPLANYRELAEILEVPAVRVWRWAKELGLPHRRYATRVNDDMKELLRALVAERPLATYTELAEILHLPVCKVMRWVKRMGLPHHDGRK